MSNRPLDPLAVPGIAALIRRAPQRPTRAIVLPPKQVSQTVSPVPDSSFSLHTHSCPSPTCPPCVRAAPRRAPVCSTAEPPTVVGAESDAVAGERPVLAVVFEDVGAAAEGVFVRRHGLREAVFARPAFDEGTVPACE